MSHIDAFAVGTNRVVCVLSSSVSDWCHTIEQLQAILTHICTSTENLIPSVLVGIMASLTTVLQHLAANNITCKYIHVWSIGASCFLLLGNKKPYSMDDGHVV